MQKILEYLDLLDEATLTPKTLTDVNGQTKIPRYTILHDLARAGKPIELGDGRKVTIDTAQSQDAMEVLRTGNPTVIQNSFKGGGKNRLGFITTAGEKIFVNQLKKADYFGGGSKGGSGGGAAQTAAQEAAQAVACAIGVTTGTSVQSTEDLTPANMIKSRNKFSITTPNDKVIEMFSSGMWPQTFANSTNALFQSFPRSKKMIFHHSSQWVKQLEAVFNKVNKSEGKYFSNINKWNPSDIWATSIDHPLPGREVETMVGLNKWLQEMFDSAQVYGISLKAAPKNATAKRVNYHGDPKDLINIAIKRLLTTKKNNLFGSKDAYIVYEGETVLGNFDHLRALVEDNEIQFRSFGGDDSIQGEIKGKYAAHGKVGNSGINAVLRKFKLKELTPRKQILAQSDRNMEKLVDQIIKNAKKVSPVAAKEAKDTFMAIAPEMKMNMLVSKYQSIETLANIKAGDKDQQNKVIQELLGYAASQSELSSVFIKIS